MMKKHTCDKCVNRYTPLCDACTVIKHPDGTETKPSYFVRHTEIDLSALDDIHDRPEWLKAYVLTHVALGVPVPTSIVLKYNAMFEAVDVELDDAGCVACGDVVPEGRQVCPNCEKGEETDA
jgi:RNA polymerase subunit RPABC4/transcription elongation factor Spt4